MKCSGITRKNKKCKNNVKNTKMCRYHKNQENKKCYVCYEKKEEFNNFGCGHSLCKTCTDKMNNFDCPFCRYYFKYDISNTSASKIEENMENLRNEELEELAIRFGINFEDDDESIEEYTIGDMNYIPLFIFFDFSSEDETQDDISET